MEYGIWSDLLFRPQHASPSQHPVQWARAHRAVPHRRPHTRESAPAHMRECSCVHLFQSSTERGAFFLLLLLALNKPSSSSSSLCQQCSAPQGQAESGGMVLVAYAGPVRPALRDSVLCLPTDIHSLFVNKPSSSSSSSSSWSLSVGVRCLCVLTSVLTCALIRVLICVLICQQGYSASKSKLVSLPMCPYMCPYMCLYMSASA